MLFYVWLVGDMGKEGMREDKGARPKYPDSFRLVMAGSLDEND